MRIAAEALTRRFGGHVVLDGVSCVVERGSSLAVLGRSGRGKSTLLQVLAGLDQPQAGRATWDGVDIYAQPAAVREGQRLRSLGLLRQNPHLDPLLTAEENVLLAATFRTVPQARERADRLLERAGLDSCRGVPAAGLSGGQRIRTALVRALLPAPRALLADEPTATLDLQTAHAIEDLLFALAADEGLTLVVATHEPRLALRCSTRFDLDEAGAACA